MNDVCHSNETAACYPGLEHGMKWTGGQDRTDRQTDRHELNADCVVVGGRVRRGYFHSVFRFHSLAGGMNRMSEFI